MHAAILAHDRRTIFHEQYGNEIDAGATLADLVIAAGDYLARIVGKDQSDAGMAAIVARVVATAGNTIGSTSDWRRALSASRGTCFSEWPLGQRLHDLAAYAWYGIVLDDHDAPDARAQYLEDLIAEAEAFQAASPIDAWEINSKGESELSRLIMLASNRWQLDNGGTVEPAALANFGGVSEGRIRNLMSGEGRTFSSVDGRISATEAVGWLAGRKDYWNSIWREQPLPQLGLRDRPPLSEPIFVPVSRDGSVFHPGLRRGSGYTIGEKGSERQLDAFTPALAELQQMPVPYWRRPNASGNWGIVAGVNWERLDSSDLDFIAANPTHKLKVQHEAASGKLEVVT